MTCPDCDLKDANIRHLIRRLEKPDIGYTERRRTADWMRLFDERADLKVEVEKLKYQAQADADEFTATQFQLGDAALRICELNCEIKNLQRENGELRSRIALLTEMIDE